MAYSDITHAQSAETAHHPLRAWLFPPHPGVAHARQMLLAAALSAASIVAVAAALLIHS